MKFLAVFVAICALSQTAAAQTPDCKSISDSAARLACYDKSAAPPASVREAGSLGAPASKVDSSKYVDSISAEDAMMNAKIEEYLPRLLSGTGSRRCSDSSERVDKAEKWHICHS